MADPLSIAASALAVAGAGGKLAQTLYVFIESVRKSEKHLKPVVDHVKLTSVVLDNIGSLLSEQDVQALCKDSLLGTTSDALEGCRQVFEDLRTFISRILKPDGNGKAKIGTFDKLTFIPFRSRELDVLQANLERFKSALDLVLSVLNLSLSIKNNKDAAQVQQLKLEVEHLLRAKKDAEDAAQAAERAKPDTNSDAIRVPDVHQCASSPVTDVTSTSRSATLTTTFRSVTGHVLSDAYLPPSGIPLPAESDYFPPPPPSSSSLVMNVRNMPKPSNHVTIARSVARPCAFTKNGVHEQNSQAVQARSEGPPQRQSSDESDAEDELLQHLQRCSDAVAHLSTMIEEATQRWRASRRYERHRFTPAFHAAHKAMKKLWAFEVDFEPPDDDASLHDASVDLQGTAEPSSSMPGSFDWTPPPLAGYARHHTPIRLQDVASEDDTSQFAEPRPVSLKQELRLLNVTDPKQLKDRSQLRSNRQHAMHTFLEKERQKPSGQRDVRIDGAGAATSASISASHSDPESPEELEFARSKVQEDAAATWSMYPGILDTDERLGTLRDFRFDAVRDAAIESNTSVPQDPVWTTSTPDDARACQHNGQSFPSCVGLADQMSPPEINIDYAPPEGSSSSTREEQPHSLAKKKHPKTFQCHLCPKSFTRAYNLRSHLRVHSEERPFVCAACEKAFARRQDRERHERLHSDHGDMREGRAGKEEMVALDSATAKLSAKQPRPLDNDGGVLQLTTDPGAYRAAIGFSSLREPNKRQDTDSATNLDSNRDDLNGLVSVEPDSGSTFPSRVMQDKADTDRRWDQMSAKDLWKVHLEDVERNRQFGLGRTSCSSTLTGQRDFLAVDELLKEWTKVGV